MLQAAEALGACLVVGRKLTGQDAGIHRKASHQHSLRSAQCARGHAQDARSRDRGANIHRTRIVSHCLHTIQYTSLNKYSVIQRYTAYTLYTHPLPFRSPECSESRVQSAEQSERVSQVVSSVSQRWRFRVRSQALTRSWSPPHRPRGLKV